MENKISIIVPIYNVEKYLPRCIESILNQSFIEFELILVNDGSPDRCGEICDEYAKKDKRIKVIHQENRGLSSARNTGINIATAEFIAFVDSDDFIHNKMYELLYKNAIKTSSDIAICDYSIVKENETINDFEINTLVEPLILTNVEALNELYSINNVKFVVAWNKLYRRNLFSDLRYEEGRIHEDELIIHKLLYKCSKLIYLPTILYFYQQRSNSIISLPFNLKKLDEVYALKDRVDFFNKVKLKELQYKAEFGYMEALYVNYRKVRANKLIIPNNGVRDFRINLFKSLKSLIKNPFHNKKVKMIWILFITIPVIYDWSIKFKNYKKKKNRIAL